MSSMICFIWNFLKVFWVFKKPYPSMFHHCFNSSCEIAASVFVIWNVQSALQHWPRCPGGSAVRALDMRLKGSRFNAQPIHYQVTVLGKLFTPTCLCRYKWSSGCCRLVTFRLRFVSHCRHLQATLSKLLTYYVLRPTQLPTLRGMGNE